MSQMHVKKGDTVKIIAGGANKKKTGEVIEVMPEKHAVIVNDVNVQIKHKKSKNAQDQGGRVNQPGPIDASNVMIVCPACKETTRVSYKITEEDGKKSKVRVCKKCGAVLDNTKVESARAKKERKEKEKAAKKEKKESKKKIDRKSKIESKKKEEPVSAEAKNE